MSGMRPPQWPHDFELSELPLCLTAHLTIAIKASGTKTIGQMLAAQAGGVSRPGASPPRATALREGRGAALETVTWGYGITDNFCPQIGQKAPISGMRPPQWPHDFELIELPLRFAARQTKTAIRAGSAKVTRSHTSMTTISGKPMGIIERSISPRRLWVSKVVHKVVH